MSNLHPGSLDEPNALEQNASSPFRDYCIHNLSPINFHREFRVEQSPLRDYQKVEKFNAGVSDQRIADSFTDAWITVDKEACLEDNRCQEYIFTSQYDNFHQISISHAEIPPERQPPTLVEPNNLLNVGFEKSAVYESRQNSQHETNNHSHHPPESTTTAFTCNCKRSRCLKLYCECFAKGRGCSEGCKCEGCRNNDLFSEERAEAIKAIRERLPNHFLAAPTFDCDHFIGDSPQFAAPLKETPPLRRGCNCKRSACRKRYCDCFESGNMCGPHCSCENCGNKVEDAILKGGLMKNVIAKPGKASSIKRTSTRPKKQSLKLAESLREGLYLP
eukprot:TRINITY_DN6324_c0_g1_i1.p1 TRINITY_DN6324_c0_g1~~TRINITY_DN6324_c0_g1_i1.p1  ORF type:complete len:332 (-),score=48.60 TRINITY_DN6324_c0_g1_i1:83-1078(-)